MKKSLLFISLSLAVYFHAYSQNSGNEALVKYRSIKSQLNEKSDTLYRKFYQLFEFDLQKDEMALVKYASFDYAVSLYVRNSSGDTVGSLEIPKYYHDKGSYLTYLFKQDGGGKYQLLLTSKDTMEKGPFTMHLAHFNPSQYPYDEDWEFCQKLDYLLQHSATDFQFIAGPKTKEFSLTNTRTTDVYLVTPSTCEIEYFTGDVYVCTILERINLEKCIQKLKELDYEIKRCLTPEWKISEKKLADVTDMNKPRFEKEMDYRLLGKPTDDHNDFHDKYNLKYSVRFLIEKDPATGYDFKIIIE